MKYLIMILFVIPLCWDNNSIFANETDILFIRSENGFHAYEIKKQDNKINFEKTDIYCEYKIYGFHGTKNSLTIIGKGEENEQVTFTDKKYKGYIIRSMFLEKTGHYKTAASIDGEKIAVCNNSPSGSIMTIYKWIESSPLFEYENPEQIYDFILSQDGDILIFWEQKMNNLKYILTIMDIATKTIVSTIEVPVCMGYSGLYPINVYCKNKETGVFIAAMQKLEKGLCDYTKYSSGEKVSITEEEFYKQIGQYKKTYEGIYESTGKKFTTKLVFRDLFDEENVVSIVKVSNSKNYIGLTTHNGMLYAVDINDKIKVKLSDKIFNSFFCWSY